MTVSLADLPLEVLAFILESVDYKTIGRFEIAFPPSANSVRWWKVQRLYIELQTTGVQVDDTDATLFTVDYAKAIACLRWLRARTRLSTLELVYPYRRQLPQRKEAEIVVEVKDWSKHVKHVIANFSSTYFFEEADAYNLVAESPTTDIMTISYRSQFEDHVCYQSECCKDELLTPSHYFAGDTQSTFDIHCNSGSAVTRLMVRLKNPMELRILGHPRRSPYDIFNSDDSVVCQSVEKVVFYCMHDNYALYDWENITGLHTWFPRLTECTLVDPTFPRDLKLIWAVVRNFTEVNRSLQLKLQFLGCSREAESPHERMLHFFAMARMFDALTCGTPIAATELDDRSEVVFKRVDREDAVSVHLILLHYS